MKRMSDVKNKNERKYLGILRNLGKSDGSVFNTFKITIVEGKFSEDKERNLIASSIYKSCPDNLVNKNINQVSIENMTKISKDQKGISDRNEIQTLDYPDSSDLSDNE